MNKIMMTVGVVATVVLVVTMTERAAMAMSATEFPAMVEKAEKVCASKLNKSPKLTAACATKVWPQVLKDGTRFFNVGIGAELNALIANQ
jgi:hypothetical protein